MARPCPWEYIFDGLHPNDLRENYWLSALGACQF